MKIRMASYNGIMMIRGGPHIQILETLRHLRNADLDIDLLDMWAPAEDSLDCDLIHLFGSGIPVFHFARLLHERSLPYVVSPIFYTRHSAKIVRRISQVDRLTRKYLRGFWWDYGMVRDVCCWARAVLPNTAAEGNLIADSFGIAQEKIHVVPNGVNSEFQKGDPALFESKYGVKDFILNVGHIGPDRKNTLALVQALKKIDHPAVIIGRVTPGGEAEQIKAIAAQYPHILLIEGLDNSSPLLASAYAVCNTFVLPSKFETPGIAALEAALAGAKVVITPHGGTREYFEDKAEYVDPYSVSSIRSGIQKALAREKNDELRDHIIKEFLWERVAERTLSVYRDVTSRSV